MIHNLDGCCWDVGMGCQVCCLAAESWHSLGGPSGRLGVPTVHARYMGAGNGMLPCPTCGGKSKSHCDWGGHIGIGSGLELESFELDWVEQGGLVSGVVLGGPGVALGGCWVVA